MKEFFQGKIGRSNFLLRNIIFGLVFCCAVIIVESYDLIGIQLIGVLLFIADLAFFYNAVCLRLNDLKKSWSYFSLIFLPIADIYLFYLLFIKEGEKD